MTPTELVWSRPRKGEKHLATLLAGGAIRLDDGREFASPSGAAMAAAQVVSYDGWYAWRLVSDGRSLNDLRHHVADAGTAADTAASDQLAFGDSDGGGTTPGDVA